ncbi:NAD(P)/FAD-dependent oxidoreductase [Prosthecobacter sp.]|uniref:NAD(P)/FAD-dependent oxidoreductase n=1 Tax=Prosthecobacter sp. TaxID=1965333 RepID=UPI00248986F6|nr:NAD(P)/FAD-dependent oxidoreductase [Prosthecobacter sp.]MDI1311812.1 NAD(P)/FAD-dependent oxidoreductase [Prosthecobacter sp.]
MKHVLILGGGFAGLECAKRMRDENIRVTLVDRWNHHLFQPLLYQVASGALAMAEIAQPLRSILSSHKNVATLMDDVVHIDLPNKQVQLKGRVLDYDFLVIALGAKTSFFGHDDWAQHTLGLKSLDDAMAIRKKVLLAFEEAESAPDAAVAEKLLTMVVVGGGPTGVEMAGSLAELAQRVLKDDFRHIDPTRAKVHLIEAGPKLLPMFPGGLPDYTRERLESMGVTVHLNCPVKEVGEGYVIAGDQRIDSGIIIWGAGVEASAVSRTLAGVTLDRAGRIEVLPDLSLPGHPEVFAAGDIVALTDKNGIKVPGVSPAAIQMGSFIAHSIQNKPVSSTRPAFAYWDKGSMATIGRSAAVVSFAGVQMRGFIAWLMWLFVHLVFLMNMRNRVSVFLHWAWSYCTWQRGARVIQSSRDS